MTQSITLGSTPGLPHANPALNTASLGALSTLPESLTTSSTESRSVHFAYHSAM